MFYDFLLDCYENKPFIIRISFVIQSLEIRYFVLQNDWNAYYEPIKWTLYHIFSGNAKIMQLQLCILPSFRHFHCNKKLFLSINFAHLFTGNFSV